MFLTRDERRAMPYYFFEGGIRLTERGSKKASVEGGKKKPN